MRLNKLFVLMLSAMLLLSLCSYAYALDEIPGFCYFAGEVKDSSGKILPSGEVRSYIDGNLVMEDDSDKEVVGIITNGVYNITVPGNYDGKTVDFKVTVDDKEYTTTNNSDTKWESFGVFEGINLTIDASIEQTEQTGQTGTTGGGSEASSQSKVEINGLKSALSMKVGESKKIEIATNPIDALKTFTTGDRSVATVDADGLVAAVAKGNTTISVTAQKTNYTNGVASVSVAVYDDSAQMFSDLLDTYWAKSVIYSLSQKGIVGGYSDGTFKPSNNITRAEFAQILTKALGMSGETPSVSTYTDVVPGAWYYGSVEASDKAGLIKGYETGEFRPDAKISRQEVAVILIRALKMEGDAVSRASEKTSFTDDADIASWARGFVTSAAQQGLVSGNTDNTFKANNNATRAEACAMIYRVMEKGK